MSKPPDIKNPYTASTWFLTINPNQVTDLASWNLERIYHLVGDPRPYLVKYNKETKKREGLATSKEIKMIEVSRARETGKRGQYHMHALWRVLVNRPYAIQLDGKKLKKDITALNGGSAVYVHWELVEDNALRIKGYMRKDFTEGDAAEIGLDDMR